MRREEALQRIALRRVKDDFLGLRVWFYLLGGGCAYAAFAALPGTPLWQRAALLVFAAKFLVSAHGLARARPWSRLAATGVCLGVILTDFPAGLLSPFGILFLLSAASLWLPSTSARFRRANAAPPGAPAPELSGGARSPSSRTRSRSGSTPRASVR